MELSTTITILLMTLQSIVKIPYVQANGEKTPRNVTLKYRGYGVADAWAGLIWNRFPAEAYPLFVSPLLEVGRFKEAQKRSRVWNLTSEDIESYSGYITVHKKYGSHMFFWFFPAETQKTEAPVLLWLNGGPGRTSLVGALLENGPLEVNENGTEWKNVYKNSLSSQGHQLMESATFICVGKSSTSEDLKYQLVKRRDVSWTQNFSMLYVDNPVGVGYSFLKDDKGLSRTMKDVTENLYSVVIQFFQMFPQYSQLPFYVGGQSYAGKYVPTLGYHLHERNTDPQTPRQQLINFKGIYLGAGYCDPEHMMPVFADYLYHSGLISNDYRQSMKKNFAKIFREWRDSKKSRTTLDYLGEFFSLPSRIIGINSVDNLLGAKATNNHLMRGLNNFMNSPATRIKLHVGYASVGSQEYMLWSEAVANRLNADILVNTNKQNAFLMDHYKVLHYSGNLDVVVNVPMTEAFLEHVQWTGQQEYGGKERQTWYVDGELAGWVALVRNFTRVIIRNSGHMAPYDQPERTLAMMNSFVFDQPFQPRP